jgi:hypothetical protein
LADTDISNIQVADAFTDIADSDIQFANTYTGIGKKNQISWKVPYFIWQENLPLAMLSFSFNPPYASLVNLKRGPTAEVGRGLDKKQSLQGGASPFYVCSLLFFSINFLYSNCSEKIE